jgi:hypothetical protein
LKIKNKNNLLFKVLSQYLVRNAKKNSFYKDNFGDKIYHAADVREGQCYKLLPFLEAALISLGRSPDLKY